MFWVDNSELQAKNREGRRASWWTWLNLLAGCPAQLMPMFSEGSFDDGLGATSGRVIRRKKLHASDVLSPG